MVDAGKIAYVFPGQGSQKVGMGHDLFDSFKSAREVFIQADETLGFSLSRLCFEGPENELKQTVNTQPALVTVSLACYQAAIELCGKENVPAPVFLAGHSLGEYTALAISGVLDYSSAIYLARERGRLMQEAGEKNPGGMAAILGLDENTVDSICKETGTWMANFNCPGQIVISGDKTSIEKAIALAISKGAIRALALQVSGAFHSPLMQPASQGLESIINKLTFCEPVIPVIGNVSALPLNTVQSIKKELISQLTSGVKWQQSIEYMIGQGVNTFIEIGPGKVLSGLIKRINKNVKTIGIGEIGELKAITGL